MAERRYSAYRQEDVWTCLYQVQQALGIDVIDGTVQGHSVGIRRNGQAYRAVVLARASDWYHYSLNCIDRWKHEVSCVICGTHDSCLPVPVLAIDSMRWYEPLIMRVRSLEPAKAPQVDHFARQRKFAYGHNMLIGALLCGRRDAEQRLMSLPSSTRRRIVAKLRKLRLRKAGRPLLV